MRIKILGSGREVGRAAIALEYNDKAILLDYGVNFDERDNPVMPLHIKPSRIEALVLTHAHLDHIGAAPLLYASVAPRAYATRLTREASKIMLEDFIKLSGYYLDFESTEVSRLLENTRPVLSNSIIEAGNAIIKMMPSGHIPGALSTLVEVEGVRVLYTSDVNNIDTKLVRGARFHGEKVDVLIIESTYGDSKHPPRSKVEKKFIEDVREVLDNEGTVLIPTFSMGRGQEILCILIENDIYPVYVDGMVRQITDIMLKERAELRNPELLEKARNEYIFVKGWQDRRKAWKAPGVIVASAGMLKGGPSRYYLRKLKSNKKNAIFLVSYQGENTPGRMILERGCYEENGELVKARIEWFDFSSHAGRDGLLEIVKSLNNLEKIIIVHGELEAQEALANEIKSVKDVEVYIPESGEVIEI